VLTVHDTGTGIPAEELPRIFERFHRVEGSRGRTHEGTGIGLALVQELVKLHGGSVRAESTPGKGSTFTVSVPTGTAHLPVDRIGAARTLAPTTVGAGAFIEEALRWLPDEETSRSFPGSVGNAREAFPPEGPAPPSPTRTPEREGDAAPRPRILWADDNADMRDYVRRLLGRQYDVEAVPDGEAALAAARARPPDLVLTDVMMPRLDGFGLLRALRADPRTRAIPVILLSARAGEESRVEGLEAGADDYLIKPFSARELLARVGAHVEMNRLRQEAFRREQALLADTQAAKQRLEAVLQSISDGFIALDGDWRYMALNDRACESMGMSREEILGRRIWDLYPDTIGTQFETELRRAAAEQKTRVFEYYFPTRNRWYENRVYPSAQPLVREPRLPVGGRRLDLLRRDHGAEAGRGEDPQPERRTAGTPG
jgi:PAS domain S-box-containing protein